MGIQRSLQTLYRGRRRSQENRTVNDHQNHGAVGYRYPGEVELEGQDLAKEVSSIRA